MTEYVDELNGLAAECDRVVQIVNQDPLSGMIDRLDRALGHIQESSSNSWIGYQSRVYYRDFRRPEPGDYFSKEWGFTSVFAAPVSANWVEVFYDDVYAEIMRLAGRPDTNELERAGKKALEIFEQNRDELVNILTILLDETRNGIFEELRGQARELKCYTESDIIDGLAPSQFVTRDYAAADQGMMPPHHVRVVAWLSALRFPFQNLEELAKIARRAAGFVSRLQKAAPRQPQSNHCIFIGHGRDPQWKDLADFLSRRLKIPVDEFNRESAAGMTTQERLQQMLERSTFAFLVMTAEDEHVDATKHARENVIHEIGLFQQKLSLRRAIVLLEEGCRDFSNIVGIVQIRFPKGYIKAAFEDIRQVLEREGVLPAG
ncbi:MAG TPA: TIR domain-containing protein [Thermoanaerobaculia bacterium]|jgi:predicted nucleotide-binding protein